MLAALLICAHSDAYELRATEEGTPVRWEVFPIKHAWVEQDLDPAGSDVAGSDAFDVWSEHSAVISFRDQPPPRVPPPGDPPGRNLCWMVWDWPFDDDVLATTASWNESDGELVAFDILVNGNVEWSTDGDPEAYDLQASVTHEVGHALGLDHSEDGLATMFGVQLPGESFRRELADDDVAAVQALYDDAPPSDPERLACSSIPRGPSGALAALFVLSLVRRRR